MNKLLPLVLLTIFMYSCQDDDQVVVASNPTIIEEDTAHQWFPMAVGNYWIYQWYNKDAQGEITYSQDFDSIYIDEETEIDGISYFSFQGSSLSPNEDKFQRASNDYILNHLGEKLFSLDEEDSFLSRVEQEHFDSEMFMINDTLLNFEIGLLNAKYIRQDIFWKNGISECTIPGWHYWGKNIGPIRREIYWASSCNVSGVELIRYQVE